MSMRQTKSFANKIQPDQTLSTSCRTAECFFSPPLLDAKRTSAEGHRQSARQGRCCFPSPFMGTKVLPKMGKPKDRLIKSIVRFTGALDSPARGFTPRPTCKKEQQVPLAPQNLRRTGKPAAGFLVRILWKQSYELLLGSCNLCSCHCK